MDALNNCFSTIPLIVCRVYNASSERTDAPCRRNLGLVTSQNANKLQKRLLPFANVFHHFYFEIITISGRYEFDQASICRVFSVHENGSE